MSESIDEILKLSKEDLYDFLKSDKDIDVDVDLEELSNLYLEEDLSEKTSADSAYTSKFSLNGLALQRSLRKIWPRVRQVICRLYKENPKIGDKDLITAVVAALGIAGNWATALVALALKLGLDKVCAVYK